MDTATSDEVATRQGQAEKDGNAPVIAVVDLHKAFGTQKVLNGISLAVKRGETLAQIALAILYVRDLSST